MDKKELETYQVQLSQVEVALTADPSNAELASLRSELRELIDLTKAAIAHAEAPKPEATRKASAIAAALAPGYAAGDEILAKYSGDGSWYPARVTSVGGSAENRVYSVVFKGYNNTELLTAAALKPLPPSYTNHVPSSKRKLSKEEEEEREKKKKKNEKKMEMRATKAKEQLSKQATWQKFTKKAEKKGVNIAGVAGTSIFKTPDNPHGRVGVTGSGKGMTDYATRNKHVFTPDQPGS
ncbi:hypothetical protein K439DRAFT_1632550 [Ramaria rubella]|nr:hypothetical protein K439DRAFT_1632550 [Ramaria rubella]